MQIIASVEQLPQESTNTEPVKFKGRIILTGDEITVNEMVKRIMAFLHRQQRQ
jgi:hypothetical protein